MAYSNVVPDHRRKWDAAEYEQLAQDRRDERRAKAEEEAAGPSKKREKREYDDDGKVKPKREILKAREFKVDLESKVGRSVVINKTTPSAETGGYYCDVCDCVVKDSMNFLDHINGKNHQRNMGMSMKVKQSTLADVKARFALKKAEKEKEKKEYVFKERMEDMKEEETKLAEYRREKKKAAKERKRPVQEPMGEAFQAMMGFGGFGGSSKQN